MCEKNVSEEQGLKKTAKSKVCLLGEQYLGISNG
jgi:hypothetical protein